MRNSGSRLTQRMSGEASPAGSSARRFADASSSIMSPRVRPNAGTLFSTLDVGFPGCIPVLIYERESCAVAGHRGSGLSALGAKRSDTASKQNDK